MQLRDTSSLPARGRMQAAEGYAASSRSSLGGAADNLRPLPTATSVDRCSVRADAGHPVRVGRAPGDDQRGTARRARRERIHAAHRDAGHLGQSLASASAIILVLPNIDSYTTTTFMVIPSLHEALHEARRWP
jgi:hypothetical protein